MDGSDACWAEGEGGECWCVPFLIMLQPSFFSALLLPVYPLHIEDAFSLLDASWWGQHRSGEIGANEVLRIRCSEDKSLCAVWNDGRCRLRTLSMVGWGGRSTGR